MGTLGLLDRLTSKKDEEIKSLKQENTRLAELVSRLENDLTRNTEETRKRNNHFLGCLLKIRELVVLDDKDRALGFAWDTIRNSLEIQKGAAYRLTGDQWKILRETGFEQSAQAISVDEIPILSSIISRNQSLTLKQIRDNPEFSKIESYEHFRDLKFIIPFSSGKQVSGFIAVFKFTGNLFPEQSEIEFVRIFVAIMGLSMAHLDQPIPAPVPLIIEESPVSAKLDEILLVVEPVSEAQGSGEEKSVEVKTPENPLPQQFTNLFPDSSPENKGETIDFEFKDLDKIISAPLEEAAPKPEESIVSAEKSENHEIANSEEPESEKPKYEEPKSEPLKSEVPIAEPVKSEISIEKTPETEVPASEARATEATPREEPFFIPEAPSEDLILESILSGVSPNSATPVAVVAEEVRVDRSEFSKDAPETVHPAPEIPEVTQDVLQMPVLTDISVEEPAPVEPVTQEASSEPVITEAVVENPVSAASEASTGSFPPPAATVEPHGKEILEGPVTAELSPQIPVVEKAPAIVTVLPDTGFVAKPEMQTTPEPVLDEYVAPDALTVADLPVSEPVSGEPRSDLTEDSSLSVFFNQPIGENISQEQSQEQSQEPPMTEAASANSDLVQIVQLVEQAEALQSEIPEDKNEVMKPFIPSESPKSNEAPSAEAPLPSIQKPDKAKAVTVVPPVKQPEPQQWENATQDGLIGIVILFLNLRDIGPVFKQLPPVKVVELLGKYFSSLTAIILGNKGTVEKLLGDTTMAIFHSGNTDEDPAMRALTSSIRISRKLNQIVKESSGAEPIPLSLGIGMHYREMIVEGYTKGELPATISMDEGIKMAGKFSAMAKNGEILFNKSLLESFQNLEGKLNVHDQVLLKGEDRPISYCSYVPPESVMNNHSDSSPGIEKDVVDISPENLLEAALESATRDKGSSPEELSLSVGGTPSKNTSLEKSCPECGEILSKTASYCTSCGYRRP